MIIRLVLVLVLALIAVFDAPPASAQDDLGWVRRTLRIERYRDWREERRQRQIMAARRGREIELREYARRDDRRRDGTRVYGFIQRDSDPRGRGECLAPRAVVGLEKYNVEEAKENAISLWMEAEKLHNGVKYMNPNNAIVISSDGRGPDCFLSSTGNRASEKLAESANKVLHQCEFRARPCSGAAEEDERKR